MHIYTFYIIHDNFKHDLASHDRVEYGAVPRFLIAAHRAGEVSG